MHTKHTKHLLSTLLFVIFLTGYGQELPSDYQTTILKLDSLFWASYNSCDLEKFPGFLSEDLEFYHDKGGLTRTSEKLVEQVKQGLCGDENVHLRREAIEESVHVYPLNKYGALISGEHRFYLNEKGKAEKLIEKAKFTHVWQFKNNQWKMSRVLSYDHQEVSENSGKAAIELPTKALQAFAGTYQAPQTGKVTITLATDNTLHMTAGDMKAQLHPETANLFFIKEAPITLEFIKNNTGKIKKFVVRESGAIVEEAQRVE